MTMEIHGLEFIYVFKVTNQGVTAFTECSYKDENGDSVLIDLLGHVHAGLVKFKLMQHLKGENKDD